MLFLLFFSKVSRPDLPSGENLFLPQLENILIVSVGNKINILGSATTKFPGLTHSVTIDKPPSSPKDFAALEIFQLKL